jgi:hypothetical protein
MLPIRGPEPWKEAKVGVIYRHDVDERKPVEDSARYVAVVNGMGEFAPVLQDALRVEKAEEVATVIALGDGAICNWRLFEQLLPNAIQILDWYHALHHAVDCGKALLGEESPLLTLWQSRCETPHVPDQTRCRAVRRTAVCRHPAGRLPRSEACSSDIRGMGRGVAGDDGSSQAQDPGRL